MEPFSDKSPAFLRCRETVDLSQFERESFRLGLANLAAGLGLRPRPPLRSWRTGRYLVIELEDNAP